MTPNDRHSWRALSFYSLVGFGLAIYCFQDMNPRSGIPAEAALLEASGRLAWVQEYEYGTRFGLEGVREDFNYPSKAKGMAEVRNALGRSRDQIVSVRYDSDSYGPLGSDRTYHDVWELNVGGRNIRSYATTAAEWESDNRLAPWLGAGAASCAFYLAYMAWRERKSERQKAA